LSLDQLEVAVDFFLERRVLDLGENPLIELPGFGEFPAVDVGDAQVDAQVEVLGRDPQFENRSSFNSEIYSAPLTGSGRAALKTSSF
jgi:hypothetical protein